MRFEMAELAAGEAEGLAVSEVEVCRDGPSYAFETLEILRESHPGVELVWLMGADAALGLESWKRPERIVELARLGIAGRQGVVRSDLDEVLARVGVDLDGDDVVEIEMPTIGISSSALRERARSGRPIDRFVPAPVAELIAQRGLYGG